jgi:acyl carrier protein
MVNGVYEKVRELLASQFEADISKIDGNTNIAEDLGADSLDFVEMIMMLEEEFGIVVTDESMYSFKTVREVTEFIEKTLEKSGG